MNRYREFCQILLEARRLIRLVLPLALAVMLFSTSVVHAQDPTRDIDLVAEKGLWFMSQIDYRWARYPIANNSDLGNITIGSCGCLIADLASIAALYSAGPVSLPLFTWLPITAVQGVPTSPELTISPRYLDVYLRERYRALNPDGTVALNADQTPQSGYNFKPIADNTCGTFPKPWALGASERALVAGQSPTGIQFRRADLDWRSRLQIRDELNAGKPVIVGIKLLNPDGTPQTDANGTIRRHAQIIAGWEMPRTDDNGQYHKGKYRILDPALQPFGLLDGHDFGTRRPQAPGDGDEAGYDAWYNSIDSVIRVFPVFENQNQRPRTWQGQDDPSPVEFLVIAPDGRRTGFDPTPARRVAEDPSIDYGEFGGWADPFGIVPSGPTARYVQVFEPVDGTYRMLVTGTGRGHATINFSSTDGSAETALLSVDKPIGPGESLKYEVHYSAGGSSSVQEVPAFTPEAKTGSASQHTTINSAVNFDGTASFDVAGSIVGYRWDFGDGSTATGSTSSHTYSAAGVYSATLTVTNDAGQIGTRASQVFVTDPSAPPPSATTEMVSVTETGQPVAPNFTNPAAFEGTITDDGQFVAFQSGAALVAADTNAVPDIYVRDLAHQTVTRVSVSSTGQQANGRSNGPVISRNGRFVAFVSIADNLVPGDTNGLPDVFVHDRQTGDIERVSVSSTGQQGNSSSASTGLSISADGRFVAFVSSATNLIPEGTAAASNVYVRDRQTGTTEIVSVSSTGQQGSSICDFFGCTLPVSDTSSISADGRYVAFESNARNLVPNDSNNQFDVFLRDRQTGTTERVSLSNTGFQITRGESPSISDDGRYVAFQSDYLFPTIQMDVFVRDRQAHTTQRVSISTGDTGGNNNSFTPGISPDGRFVAFQSLASNLVPSDTNGGTDVFLRDRLLGTTERVNVTNSGGEAGGLGGGALSRPSISRGGSVVFNSQDAQLVPLDTNGLSDVFIRTKPSPKRPTAVISGPYSGWADPGGTRSYINFDGRGSYDAAGVPLTARWDFGDGSPVVQNNATALQPHSYTTSGTYTATLIVNDGTVDSLPATTSVQVLAPAAASPVATLVRECASPGDQLSVFMRGSPLVATTGGFNFGTGAPSSTGLAQPLTSLPLVFSGPGGVTTVNGSVIGVSVDDGVEFTTTVQVSMPALAPGQYLVGTPGATPATLKTPCAPVVKRAPTADAGGPYTSLTGGTLKFDGSASRDPQGGTLIYYWQFGDGVTGTGVAPQHVYQTPGDYFVTLEVGNGTISSRPAPGDRSFTHVVVVNGNQPPIVNAGTAYHGTEGSAITLSGATASDPNGDALTYTWTANSPRCTFTSGSILNPAVRCTDNGNFTVTLTASDGKAAAVSSAATLTVDNANPVITAVNVPAAAQTIGTIRISAPFTDLGASDTHTCSVTWGDGAAASGGTVTETPGSGAGTCAASRLLPAGLYVVTVAVLDDDGGLGSRTASSPIVVYDTSAGSVTGGGWFMSAAGADRVNPTAAGKVNFGFEAKYKQGATVPDGETEFQFQAGNLNFHSTAYQWLVVTNGCYAQYKGTGTVNGVAGFDFLLTLRDGELCGSVGADGIRMKITPAGGVRYDNSGGSDNIGPTSGNVQRIDGGSIVIHRGK